MTWLARDRVGARSFRMVHPLVRPASAVEVTAVSVLAIAAVGLWLFVLPLELVRFLR